MTPWGVMYTPTVWGNEIFGKKIRSHIFNLDSYVFWLCDFEKVIFGQIFDEKGTFRAFLCQNVILGHFWPFFVLTASYLPIKVPQTIKKYTHIYRYIYKHVFIKYFWAERCIFGGICGFLDLHAVCMQIPWKWNSSSRGPSTAKSKDIGGMGMGDVHKILVTIFWPLGVRLACCI